MCIAFDTCFFKALLCEISLLPPFGSRIGVICHTLGHKALSTSTKLPLASVCWTSLLTEWQPFMIAWLHMIGWIGILMLMAALSNMNNHITGDKTFNNNSQKLLGWSKCSFLVWVHDDYIKPLFSLLILMYTIAIFWDATDLKPTILNTLIHSFWVLTVCFVTKSRWNLLDIVLRIVEKNPKKFKMEDSELRERKGFVKMTKNSVKVCCYG